MRVYTAKHEQVSLFVRRTVDAARVKAGARRPPRRVRLTQTVTGFTAVRPT